MCAAGCRAACEGGTFFSRGRKRLRGAFAAGAPELRHGRDRVAVRVRVRARARTLQQRGLVALRDHVRLVLPQCMDRLGHLPARSRASPQQAPLAPLPPVCSWQRSSRPGPRGSARAGPRRPAQARRAGVARSRRRCRAACCAPGRGSSWWPWRLRSRRLGLRSAVRRAADVGGALGGNRELPAKLSWRFVETGAIPPKQVPAPASQCARPPTAELLY